MNFASTANAIASVFLMALIGYISVKRRVLTHDGVSQLARVLVDFILPATLFHAMFTQYTPEKLPFIGMAGCAQLSLISTAALLGYLLSRFTGSTTPGGTVAALSSMQNNVYIPLPVSMAVLSAADGLKAQFFIGCFVVFFTPTMWSFGVWMMLGNKQDGKNAVARLVHALKPPFFAAILGLLLKILFLHIGWEMPRLVLSVTKLTGDATTPLAMIVLGGMLAEARWSRDFEPRAVAIVGLVKLVLLPLFALIALKHIHGLDPIFAFIVLLEAASPPATNLSIAAKRFGIETNLMALTIFVTYLASILTIPFWLSQL